MTEHWYQLVESDDGFVKSAPFRYENSVEVPAPPERTWELLTTDDTLVSWTRLVTSLRWLSPRPFGVGTVRELTLLGLLTGRERYFRWAKVIMPRSPTRVILPVLSARALWRRQR